MLPARANILTHIMVQKGTKPNVHRFQVWDNGKNVVQTIVVSSHIRSE
jgi:hypothetical protein